MAESQLECMEDGRIGESVPESRPEFYYSEQQRVALEELLKDGDGAFKTRLREDNFKDFLSARELKTIQNTFVEYKTDENKAAVGADSVSLRSTYWPQLSDIDVPTLDMGWPSGGFFRGVTRVTVHTHPPKANGPHIKEVVRRLIQEATKVIGIVMDLLTDLQILQDLLDASFKRNVAVYIILDNAGMPHFLDMCTRLQVKSHHLQNVRTRTVRGLGLDMALGRIPGSLCHKYMIVDGDKVMFGSYSFSWSSSRMDRNMITVMTGQIVDIYDQDFRELYAISDELDLFKEFSISKTGTMSSLRAPVPIPRRPSLTGRSRFQVSLGDAGTLKIPAHKYHNPKYLLAFGKLPDDNSYLQDMINKMEPEKADENPPTEVTTSQAGSKRSDSELPLPSSKKAPSKKFTFKMFSRKSKKGSKRDGNEAGQGEEPGPSTRNKMAMRNDIETITENPEEPTVEPVETAKAKGKKPKKKSKSPQTDNSQENQDLPENKNSKRGCVQS
ncbi:protein FAM83F [Trichomycterus rosablanca]|uniref:protein FAM83F n=1 Tax=Trichomycterus rosablanca TaxID=2290929 RepID=UPI002F35B8C0